MSGDYDFQWSKLKQFESLLFSISITEKQAEGGLSHKAAKKHKEIHKKQLKSSFFLLIISFVTFVSIFYDSTCA